MNIFLISDQHYNHSNILGFKRSDGTLLRPGFDDVNHMNEHMIECHNKVVRPNDKIYFLGDVAMGNATTFDKIMARLNGEKVLIKGNHDGLKLSQYAKWFKDVRAYHVMDKFVLSHIPIHVESLSRWRANLHGHLHYQTVKLPNGQPDDRYLCLCMEQHHINYTPIAFEEIRKMRS